MLKIFLEDLNRLNIKKCNVGTRSRLATSSGIYFIDSTHFIVCSMVGTRIYLYNIDGLNKDNVKLLCFIDTTYNNELVMTDLLDYRDGYIIGSNFRTGTQTMYSLTNNKLEHYKDLKNFSPVKNYCHGVKFYRDHVICFTYNVVYSVNFVDIKRDELIYTIETRETCGNNFNPKDVEFIDENKMLILFTSNKVHESGSSLNTGLTGQTKIVLSCVDILNKTYDILDSIVINDSHSDSIKYYKHMIFINNQVDDSIDIFHIKDNKIFFHKSLLGFNFPHGVAIEPKNDLLAVTNYGDNSINIIKMQSDILDIQC